jgi:hypothetical protein
MDSGGGARATRSVSSAVGGRGWGSPSPGARHDRDMIGTGCSWPHGISLYHA